MFFLFIFFFKDKNTFLKRAVQSKCSESTCVCTFCKLPLNQKEKNRYASLTTPLLLLQREYVHMRQKFSENPRFIQKLSTMLMASMIAHTLH